MEQRVDLPNEPSQVQESDYSKEELKHSIVMMLKSIKGSMEHLEDEVSDMVETLEVLLPVHFESSGKEMK